MTDMKPWAFELEEYIREGEPDRARRAELWQVAIGLQDVDGLTPSQYLLDTAKEHIEGELSIDQVQPRIAGVLSAARRAHSGGVGKRGSRRRLVAYRRNLG